MEENRKNVWVTLQAISGIIALLGGIAMIVFSMIDIPSSMMWQVIWGAVMMVMGILWLIFYVQSRKRR